MAKKGQIQNRYSTEFKMCVILDMREHRLSYHETVSSVKNKFSTSLIFKAKKSGIRIIAKSAKNERINKQKEHSMAIISNMKLFFFYSSFFTHNNFL